jgi:hypothetical protein
MRLDIDADAYDGYVSTGPIGTVHIDIVLKGRGASTIASDQGGVYLDWTEIWYDVKAWGRVDGERIAGPHTQASAGRMGYWLDGWVRST